MPARIPETVECLQRGILHLALAESSLQYDTVCYILCYVLFAVSVTSYLDLFAMACSCRSDLFYSGTDTSWLFPAGRISKNQKKCRARLLMSAPISILF